MTATLPKLNVHEVCATLAHNLEADWGQGPHGMCGRHGEATKHFALVVRSGEIELHCLTSTAASWHRIVKVIGQGAFLGYLVRRVDAWRSV